MPRRLIVKASEIYRRRGNAWAYHYRNRETARNMSNAGWSGVKIEMTLNQYLPEPIMEIDGNLLDIPLNIRREHANRLLNTLNISMMNRELLTSWYWTEDGWQKLVHYYQALPDVYEDYYFLYEPEPIERLVLTPMSAKPKQGSKEIADKYVDKSGTSQVQVQAKRYI